MNTKKHFCTRHIWQIFFEEVSAEQGKFANTDLMIAPCFTLLRFRYLIENIKSFVVISQCERFRDTEPDEVA